MNLEELKNLVALGESEKLEFKKSTGSLKSIMQTLCGFLNGVGGMVLIGITPERHKIVGQEVKDYTERKIAEMFNKMDPSAPVNVTKVSIANTNKQVIVLETHDPIPAATYQFDGRAYQRVGTTTTQMSQHAYQQLIMERVQSCVWDKLQANGCTIDMLDIQEIHDFIQDAIMWGRLTKVAKQSDPMQILQNLKLVENGKINNAAVVLFAKDELAGFDHCNIKMARFNGNDRNHGFLDEKRFCGNAFTLLREAEIFIKRHLSLAMKVTSASFQREESYALPILAVREALVNAIIHRDYSSRIAAINMAVYNDWMEIWNIGSLPSTLKLEELKLAKHSSCPRNKLISEIFFKRKLFEGWGTGTTNIIRMCRRQNLKDPIFTEYSGGFCVQFYMEKVGKDAKYKKLSLRQKEILTILKTYPDGVTSVKLITELGEQITNKTIRRELHKLELMNLVNSIGTTKDKLWHLVTDQ